MQINELTHKLKKLEREISAIKADALKDSISEFVKDTIDVNGIYVISKQVAVESLDQLRQLADDIRNNTAKNTIALLGAVIDGKAQIVCTVTDDLKQKYPAGKIVGIAAKQLDGGGGGKPHLATAGGKSIEKLPELIACFTEIIKKY